jgi:hypothetical protein
MSDGENQGPKLADIADALGVSRPRVTQLVAEGMPTDSIEAAKAWRASRKRANERAGHIAVPIKPIDVAGLDNILNSLHGEGTAQTQDTEMDNRIAQQIELCRLTRESFMGSVQSGDPSQTKLYGNFDRAIATLMRMEKERAIRLQEMGRLVDADEAASRYGKILGQIRTLLERAELTVAPSANPDNPARALIAFREFRDDLFRKISEYAPQVVSQAVKTELSAEVKPMDEDDAPASDDDEDGPKEMGDWESPPEDESK